MGTVSIIIIIASIVLALQRMSAKRSAVEAGQAVEGTIALVCELSDASAGAFDGDAAAYSSVFQTINVAQTAVPSELLNTILDTRSDVVHLFCEFAEEDVSGTKLSLAALLDACRRAEVKLLILARPNSAEYLGGTLPHERPEEILNIVATIDRKGGGYVTFLETLLHGITKQGDVARAWANAARPRAVNRDPKLPDTIFVAARRSIKLFP
jgi:hypothetical protein